MIDETLVNLSRLQFGMTAMYHFIFVPLTLGMGLLMSIMESVYVMTGRVIYKDMTRFWGKLFAINFAMGVATGVPLEFQFGTNWAYYSHYVGDIFGVPLAVEGLMAFFLESTLVGVFFFGWDRISKVQHLAVTWLMALGASLSALWILIANAWMQNPVGSEFNYDTMRMELSSIAEIIFNPVAQVKFVHTVAAGYVTGSIFILAISAFYLLRRRDVAFAQRSFAIACAFGLASALSVIVLGDESGYELGEVQQAKLAAIEAEWETQAPPAHFTIIGIPDQQDQETHLALRIPWALGLIATRSLTQPIIGLRDLIAQNEERIRSGIIAYDALEAMREGGDQSQATKYRFEQHQDDLGYGLLLKYYVEDPADATEAHIKQAAERSVPKVWPMFFAFRIMVGLGFMMLFLFATGFYLTARRRLMQNRWLLWLCVVSLPAPWLASELGWFIAEYGRQPWAIGGILPTGIGVSSIGTHQVVLSLIGFVLLYSALLVVELFLMVKYIRLGPSSLHTGRYHFENISGPDEPE